MDFLKKHYEKVLLGVVLVGLAAGAAFLPLMIAGERESLREMADKIISRVVKPLPPLELSKITELLQRGATPMSLDFSTTNKLFNPVPWQKKTDGTLLKIQLGNEVGVEAVVVTKITPLYTTITLDSVMTSDSGPRYIIAVEREAAAKPSLRPRKVYPSTLNNKNDVFVIREVKGPPEAPTELVIEMNDPTAEHASLAKDKPFKRVDGYMADLKYPPENNKSWTNLRVGAGGPGTPSIFINGEGYIIVAISKNEVVLSARSNNKKTPRPFNPGT